VCGGGECLFGWWQWMIGCRIVVVCCAVAHVRGRSDEVGVKKFTAIDAKVERAQ